MSERAITIGFLALAGLVVAAPIGALPAPVLLAIVLFAIGFGQGLGLPSLMRMVIERVSPALSGMIAGAVSSTLQVGAALGATLARKPVSPPPPPRARS